MIEYSLVSVGTKSVNTIAKELNKLAGEGWEAITSFQATAGTVILMAKETHYKADTSFYENLNRLKEIR